MKQSKPTLTAVRKQYEHYPYPPRDPQAERERLVWVYPEYLDLLNYYCFEGKQDFQKGFRVLIAGGGTGDSAIFMAEQLRETNAEIVYLDISQASMSIAKERAEARKLRNIRWHHGSLLEVAGMGLGKFDYINCSGVLHHLENPDAGLSALASVLTDDGAMMVMLYGKYGREGVYQMQELLRLLNQGEEDLAVQLDTAKRVLENLYPGNWFQRTRNRFSRDLNLYGDHGIYDLLLHSQDRAYTVPQIYALTAGAKLELVQFITLNGDAKLRYDALRMMNAPRLRAALQELDVPTRQAIAEIFCGDMQIHCFYAAKRIKHIPQPQDGDMVPFFSMDFAFPGVYETIASHLYQSVTPVIRQDKTGNSIQLAITPHLSYIGKYLDGSRSINEIIDAIRADKALQDEVPSVETLKQEWNVFYQAFNSYDWMLLRAKHVPDFKTVKELQERMS